MSNAKPKTYFRVQTVGRNAKTGSFVTRNTPSGNSVVTMNRGTYSAAKNAAAKVISSRKK